MRIKLISSVLVLGITGSLASAFALGIPKTAAVRFTNQLVETRRVTLEANQRVLWADVGPGTTTGDLMVEDTVMTFALKWSGSDSVIATTNSPMANGGHYTVSASRATGERPILSVIRDP
ncbi:MAG: hypothetical protein V4503_11115 [Gemmatimonadota bacterium]